MKLRLIQVPHHLARTRVSVGLGPIRYLEAGADRALARQGHDVDTAAVEASELVGKTLVGGFFDGMPLAVATGRGHDSLRQEIGLRPVPDEQVLLLGVRELDPGERENLERSRVAVVPAGEILLSGVRAAVLPRLEALRGRAASVYLHVDLDVLDPEQNPGTDYPAPGGLSLAMAEEILQGVADRFRIRGAALTAYNPERDPDERGVRAALRLLSALAAAAERSPSAL